MNAIIRWTLVSSLVCLSLIISLHASLAACSTCKDDRLCGPRCMLAVCQRFEVDADLGELTTLCGTDKQGSTLAGLYSAAKTKGLETVGMKIGVDELAALKTPAVAHLWKNHFVVVEAESADKLRVLDPPAEPQLMSVADFQKLYSGFALLVAKDKDLFPKSELNGADLRVGEYAWDFGVVEDGSQFAHTFTCKNEGSEGLFISNVDSTCGCTVASVSQNTIPPGGKAEINVIFNTEGKNGAQDQTVYIHSNDPITPTVQLQVSGMVKPSRLLYSPRSINFGDIRPGQNISREISLPESEARHVEIQSVSSDSRFVTTAVATRADKKGYTVTVDLHPDNAPLGELKGTVMMLTDHPKDPKVSIPFTATIKGDIDVFPDTLFFGMLKKGDGGWKKISISTASQPFKIERIDSPYDYLKVRAIPKVNGKDYDLIATLLRSAPTGYLKSEVTLLTDNSRQREIKVPVYALVEE